MKKICLSVLGLYVGLLQAFAQTKDSSQYKSRKLSIEEINLVSSYYKQDGSHSAVEGGIGTQKLSDFSNVIDLKLAFYDKKYRKHTIVAEAGLDYYSSASSDRIDAKANSSASSGDMRVYPSLSWTMENEQKGRSLNLFASSSTEYDYQSIGFGAAYSQKSKDRNREITIKGQAYLDKVTLIRPVELRPGGEDDDDYGSTSRNSYSGSLTLSQVVNKRLQMLFVAEFVQQEGFLGLPFNRVYFKDMSMRAEHLPSTRWKLPLGLRASYFLGDKLVLRGFYRFYQDSWGLQAHTAELETSLKLSPVFSLTPFYRFYRQRAVDYFAPYAAHEPSKEFFTSNFDLGDFNSHFAGMGFRYVPVGGVFGVKHWNMIELRYGHYTRSNDLSANIISMHVRIKKP